MLPISAQPIDIKGRRRCLRSWLSLKNAELDAGTNSGWAHVAMLGEWRGHSKGEFQFTQDAFTEILRNFAAQANPIPWDYEHDTFNPDTTGPKPASGWVKRLELRNNGTELWAYVDWTPRAADMIRAGEYRFCSPVVDFESFDRKSNNPIGAELLSVALTNNPFLDGQHPLALSWVAASFPPPPEDKDKQPPPPPHGQPPPQQPQGAEPKGPPGQPPHAPPFPPKKEDDKAMAQPPQQGQPPPHPPAEPGPPPPAASDPEAADAALGDGAEADANAFLEALASMSGLDKAQTLSGLMDMQDQLVNALQKTVARDGTPAEATRTMTTEKKDTTTAQPAAAPAVTPDTNPATVQASAPTGLTLDDLERQNDKQTIERMKARLDQIEKERSEEKSAAIAQLVDEKIAGGYIMPDQRANAIWAFTQDRKRAEEIYAHQVVPIGQRQSQAGGVAPNQGAAAAAAASGGGPIDMSQFSRGELATIDCLMGAHKSKEQAIAIVLKKRSDTAVH